VIRRGLLLQRPDLRDWFLIIFGVLALLLGYAYGVARVPHGVRTSIYTATQILPLKAYAFMWAAAGAYSVAAGLTSRRVGGFTVASAMFTLWGLIYLIGWLNGDPGRGWVTAALFGGLAAAVYCVSGLVDPTPIVEREPR
jgi:vacuolar-type H+-ATPase subunit I/STV1